MKKTVRYNLTLTDIFYGEVCYEHLFKSYSNPILALRMRDFLESVINENGDITIPDVDGEFNQVTVECEWCE
ncbi:hypothetical protein NVP1106O_61 [Vibrio phage 1.106.O._10N.286.51.F7]|nr:hypothetical protein NVP1106O_61 [Vibrio phage 1.106.O._10N.286.51.F7]